MTPPRISSGPTPSRLRRWLSPSTSTTWPRISGLPLFLLALILAVTGVIPMAHASPISQPSNFHTTNSLSPPPPAAPHPNFSSSHVLLKRDRFVIINSTGEPTVINPITRESVPQGPATDGGGTGFDAPTFIWIGFTVAIGLPMMFAGIRGWRLSTGVGVGLAAAVATWAPVINSIGPSGVSDLVITIIVMGFFFAGFAFGVIPYGRLVGIFCLGFAGGLAFGIRIMILRPGLLFSGGPAYATNWILIIVLGAAGGMSMIWGRSQRAGLLFACASIGTFLTFLGADIIVHKQSGFSRGLRFLFDRNASHFLDIVGGGYDPPSAALLLIGISLAATPLLAVAQHYVFKQPFDRTKESNDIVGAEENDVAENEKSAQAPTARRRSSLGPGPGARPGGGWGRGVPMSGVFGSAGRTASGLWDSWRRK